MALVAAVEGVGVLLLIPLLAVLGAPTTGGGMGRVTELFFRGGSDPGLDRSLAITFAALVAVIAVHGFLRHTQRLYTTRLVESYKHDLRTKLFRVLTRADWRFHLRSNTSRVAETITADVGKAGASLSETLSAARGLVHALVFLAIGLYLSSAATVVALAIGAVWIAALKAPMTRAKVAREEHSEAVEWAYAATSDLLRGMETAKSQADEERQIRRFEWAASRLPRAETEAGRSRGEERVLMTTGAAIAGSLLVLAGVRFLGLELATLLVLGYLVARLVADLGSVKRAVRAVGARSEATSRVDELLAEAASAAEPQTWRGAPTLVLREAVRLHHATLSAASTDGRARVCDVSLRVPARQTTALIGPPGGGRNTVGQLVRGLLMPDSGEVSIDGQVLEGPDLRGWRRSVGYVCRDIVLFDDTLLANLTDDDRQVPEVRHAIQAAQLGGLVAALPEGLKTPLRGLGLESFDGTRLLLGLARALLRKPQLLVVDDIGSSLNPEDEALIRRALRTVRGVVTVLVITDRLTLARDADLIHWIERGRRVESGTWSDLMGAGGRFRTLADLEPMETAGAT
jgi:ATP-binding cassette subfamily C protein